MKYSKRIAALLLALTLCCCAACSKTVGSYRVVKTLSTEQFRIGFRDGDQAAASDQPLPLSTMPARMRRFPS